MAEQVLCIQDLLRLVAQQANNRHTLYNACLVSHAFNKAFTPYLYQYLRWNDRTSECLIDQIRRCWLLQENTAKYVRTIVITRWYYSKITVDQISAAIIDICQHCRFLRTFAYEGIPLTTQFLRALSHLPHLENLHLAFPVMAEVSEVPRVPREHSLDSSRTLEHHPVVTNLRKLSLHYLNIGLDDKDIDDWKHTILQIMLQSPSLEQLNLSLTTAHHKRLFVWIGQQYYNRKGHRLRLKALRLGFGLDPFGLQKSVDLSVLQELSICYPLPAYIFSTDTTPKLEKVVFQNRDFWYFQAMPVTAGTREIIPRFQWAVCSLVANNLRVGIVASWRHLPVTQIILSRPILESIQGRDKEHEYLSQLAHVTDLKINTSFKSISFQSLKPLASLKKLWITNQYRGASPIQPIDAARVLPTLQYIRIQLCAWRICRRVQSDDDIVLDQLDGRENEEYGSEFFHSMDCF